MHIALLFIAGGNSFKQEEATDYARANATGLTEAQLEGWRTGRW
jgi:hypothetical protein